MNPEQHLINAMTACLRLILGEAALEEMTEDLAFACLEEAERWEGAGDERS